MGALLSSNQSPVTYCNLLLFSSLGDTQNQKTSMWIPKTCSPYLQPRFWHQGLGGAYVTLVYFSPSVCASRCCGRGCNVYVRCFWRGGYVRGGKAESTRNRWPSGQKELPSFQLVLVVKHHGVHPGYRTVLKRGTGRIRFVDSLWRPSASSIITPKESKRGTESTIIFS